MNDNKLIEETYDKIINESMEDWRRPANVQERELRYKISEDIKIAIGGVRRAIFNIMKIKDNSMRLRVQALQKILDELEKFPRIK